MKKTLILLVSIACSAYAGNILSRKSKTSTTHRLPNTTKKTSKRHSCNSRDNQPWPSSSSSDSSSYSESSGESA